MYFLRKSNPDFQTPSFLRNIISDDVYDSLSLDHKKYYEKALDTPRQTIEEEIEAAVSCDSLPEEKQLVDMGSIPSEERQEDFNEDIDLGGGSGGGGGAESDYEAPSQESDDEAIHNTGELEDSDDYHNEDVADQPNSNTGNDE